MTGTVRSLIVRSVLLLLLAILAGLPAGALKVYINPSIQQANVSPDGSYTEGSAMQDVASRIVSKMQARGFESRSGGWLDPWAAADDAYAWGANCFIAVHTNAMGGGWQTGARGTEGFYDLKSDGWYLAGSRDIADRCINKCVEKFNAWGRGYRRQIVGNDLGITAYWKLQYIDTTLVEGLFHDNPDDLNVLKSDSGRNAYAQAVYEATCDHYGWNYDIWDAAYNAQSYATAIFAGQQSTGWIEYKNTGTTTWSNSGANPVRLGTFSPQDRSSVFYTPGDWVNPYRPTNLDQASVAPNGIGRFTFVMTAPSTPGYYEEYWKLVADGKAWFGPGTGCFRITVNAADKGIISGRVTSSADGSPIAGAAVLLSTGAATTSDSDGRFSLANVPVGNYVYSVTHSQFANYFGTASVTAANTAAVSVTMQAVPDIVIDNLDAGFGCSSNWATGTYPGFYGTNYRSHPTQTTDDPAMWTPNIPVAGNWQVFAWWTQGTNRSITAPYFIDYNGARATVTVNQQANGGQWNDLGTYPYATGATRKIYLSCATTVGQYVIADAVKLVKQPDPVRGTIVGWITDAATHSAVAGASVSSDSGESAIADSGGYYSLANVPMGLHTVTAAKPGFTATTGTASVSAGLSVNCNIALLAGDAEPPSAPTGLGAELLSANQARLTWNASTDNRGVTGYRIYRDGTAVGTSAALSYTDSGLSPVTAYSYRVSAYDGAANESAQSDPAGVNTPPGPTAVFTDGFADLNNWTTHPAMSALSLDSGMNHGTLPGANGAKTTAAQSSFMYHAFSAAFATGEYEGWFYDGGTNDTSRDALQIRGYTGTTANYCFVLGPNGAQPTKSVYWEGIFDGAAWSWNSTNVNRSVGWHKFGIEVLPYTGSGDVKFYIDDAPVFTGNRPANSNSYGIDRLYVGFNYAVGIDGWYDDIVFTSQAPEAPAMGTASALSTSGIRWTWADNSNNESFFRLQNETGGAVAVAGKNATSYDEGALGANTVYSRKVVAFNGTLSSWPSATVSRCTLSTPPSASTVTCDRSPGTTYTTPSFAFTAVGGFGAGTVQSYRYAFDRSATHAWTGTESSWSSGVLAATADAPGSDWYLHLQGLNADGVANGALDLGPFVYARPTFSTPPNFVKVGWNMLSLPAAPTDPNPLAVLAGIDVPNASFQFWKNDVDGGGYQLYGETFGWTGPLQVGVPYWFLEEDSDRTVSFAGAENTSDWQITIPAHSAAPYWIALGHPFYHPTACSRIKFSSPSHPFPMIWEDAYVHTVVESLASGFEASTHSFFTVGPGSYLADRSQFEPWYGYWLLIRTTEPTTIIVPAAP